MTTKILLYATIAALTLATACGGETVVTKVEVGQRPQSSQGVLFSLPETLVVTEMPLTKTSASPGTYFQWTPFFYPELTDNDYVREETLAFKIGAPTFSTRGQTDPNNVYIAHIKAKAFETKTLLLEFNEDGIIARTEASSKDESIDILTSTIKTVASLAAPVLPFSAPVSAQTMIIAGEVKLTCQQKRAAAMAANAKAAQTAVNSAANPRSKKFKAEAKAAQKEAEKAQAEATGCYEEEFKKALSETEAEAALYESLDAAYIDFLRNNFGFDFLLYVVRTAKVEFFLTLSSKQQAFINEQPRSSVPCVDAPAATRCLATAVKIELIKAKAIYDKIQKLRQQRETILAESTAAQVNTSTHIEFRLKELDAQIKSIEATYFLGTSSEASGTARFEFKPTVAPPAAMSHDLFKYSAGGSKPGICPGSVPADVPGVFKASWPRKFLGTCHATNYQFVAGDIRDLKQLVTRLNTAGAGGPAAASDPVSAYVFGRLAPATRGLVGGPINTPQEKAAVANALNVDFSSVLTGGSIYSPALFAKERLSSDAIDLINKGRLTATEIEQLNRLLIEDTYRKEIYRQASWTEHQVSVAVASPPPGLASQVANAVSNNQLLEPGKRGFPYRVAPPTLAKLLDDDVEKGRGEVRVAQFGPVRTLPANLGGRRSSYKLTYYDSSGAIKLFDMSADALIQKQNVTDLTDAATTLRDSEAAKIKRETDLLNAKKDRLNAEKSLIEAEKALRAAQPTPTP